MNHQFFCKSLPNSDTTALKSGSKSKNFLGLIFKNARKSPILAFITLGATISLSLEANAAIVASSEFTVTSFPIGVEIDGLAPSSGGLYGTDLYAAVNGGILRVNPTSGTFTTFASGLATGAGRPSGLAFDSGIFGTGLLYVSQNNGSVVTVSPSGVVNSFSSGGTLYSSNDLVFATPGSSFGNNLIVSNGGDPPYSISKVNSTGNNSFLVPTNQFSKIPLGLAFPESGSSFGSNLFVSLWRAQTSGVSLVQVDASGNILPFANNLGLSTDLIFGSGAAFGDNIYVTDPISQSIFKVDSNGVASIFATGFNFTNAGWDADLVFSPDGNTLFVANRNEIVKITAKSQPPKSVPEPSNILGLGLIGLGLAATKVKCVLSKKAKSPTDNSQTTDS
ncbi:MAG: PEP-CTERM sorting domain-containing protein [Microcystis aeruginosa LL11-07]|nr:PEP-CTERM sorting domain-containing protein [Microcystis aeruginosa LL11-07]